MKSKVPFKCSKCRKLFSVKTGTVLAESNIKLQKWLLTVYFLTNAKKGMSSVELSEKLGVTQRTVWFLGHIWSKKHLKRYVNEFSFRYNNRDRKDSIIEKAMRNTANKDLHEARKNKKDEFYTQLVDIENELEHYQEHFRNKVVYCNCDDPRVSNFFHYFSYNFEKLGLKKLITTCHKNQNYDLFSMDDTEKAIYLEYEGDKNGNKIPDIEEIGIKELKGDGDFRSGKSIALLKQADIVVTNPPFSLFREYVAQLIEYDKKFLIIGNKNAITYKEIFKLIKENKIWTGNTPMSTGLLFNIPKEYADELIAHKKQDSGYKIIDGVVKGRAQAIWFTNLDYSMRHEDLILYKTYKGNEKDYPKYDNYNAINVDKTKDIPVDYDGAMGVPITFLDKYNPEQFEIMGLDRYVEDNPHYGRRFSINGRETYARIIIKNKKLGA